MTGSANNINGQRTAIYGASTASEIIEAGANNGPTTTGAGHVVVAEPQHGAPNSPFGADAVAQGTVVTAEVNAHEMRQRAANWAFLPETASDGQRRIGEQLASASVENHMQALRDLAWRTNGNIITEGLVPDHNADQAQAAEHGFIASAAR